MNPADTSFRKASQAFQVLVNGLEGLPRRVQTRAILPHVSTMLKQGFPLEYILEILQSKGIGFKPASLHQAVYRWRRQQLNSTAEPGQQRPQTSDAPLQPVGNASTEVRPGTQPVSPKQGERSQKQQAVEPPAFKKQMQLLREQHIDLDEINRQARARRG